MRNGKDSSQTDLFKKYEHIRIKTPQSFVICSEVFEEFLEMNALQEMAVNTENEETIAKKFLASELPTKITDELHILIEKINYLCFVLTLREPYLLYFVSSFNRDQSLFFK